MQAAPATRPEQPTARPLPGTAPPQAPADASPIAHTPAAAGAEVPDPHRLIVSQPSSPSQPGKGIRRHRAHHRPAGRPGHRAGHAVALSRTRVATFGVLSRGCPLRAQCTIGKTDRKLVLHERDDQLRAAPPGLGRPAQGLHGPPAQRGTPIAQVATWRRRRLKLPYRGTAKNRTWLKRRPAALSLRNLTGRGRGTAPGR